MTPRTAWLLAFPALALAQHRPTFNRDIAPIVFTYCAPCHRPGESGPFSLLTYNDVKSRARQIVAVTKSRYMPPWLPEPGFGEFADQRRLRAAHIETIRLWADRGAAEGAQKDLPALPRFPDGWQLGKPDMVLTMPQSYTLPAEGGDVFRNFVLPAKVSETRYVRAIEIRPGDKRVVHHANVLVDRSGAARRQDALDPGVGFGGMSVRIESGVFDPDSHFLFWKPGSAPSPEPEGMWWRIDPNTDLVLNMHMQPSGKPESIQASIGLYFAERAASKFPMLLQLERDGAIDIAPGNRDFTVSDEFTLPVDVDVIGVYPHAHYLGKEIRGYATLPDGRKKWLIWIRNWDLNWQGVYRYARPVFLPRGSVISMRIRYDNSAENVRNPNHPPKRVVAGDRSTDEMGHLWVQVLPRGGDQRPVLQEALMRQRLRKYPGEYAAHFNLGAVLLSRGTADEAIVHFREAVKTRPDEASAHNSLGAALMAEGRPDDAAGEFREALRLSPDYVDAHYNLANVLASQGKLVEARRHFRETLDARPNDAAARARLCEVARAIASALGAEGKAAEAIPYLREAVGIEPDDADTRTNLGAALATAGRLDDAETEFETALRIRPDHATARTNLERLRALKRRSARE